MIDETLYTDQVTPGKLKELVEACHAANMFPQDTWVLAERLPAHVIRAREERQNLLLFEYFPPEMPLEKLFEDYTTGRIFTNQLELRWEQQEQDIRVVYLGTKKYEFILRDYKLEEKEKMLDGLSAQPPKSYFLFGQRLRPGDVSEIGAPAKNGDFAEARIPRLLRYPVPYDLEKARRREAEEKEDGKQRIREYVKLHVREFLDERGSVAFFRFCGLTVKEIQG
jgi:hypothetical protein